MKISYSSNQLKGQKTGHIFIETSFGTGVRENEIQHIRIQSFRDEKNMLFEIEDAFEFENT